MDIKKYFDDRAKYNQYVYFNGWDNAINDFGKYLDKLITKHIHKSKSDIKALDCTCGIGTQAIGLAKEGYMVWASDISTGMIKETIQNAKERNLIIKTREQDIREPWPEDMMEQFDVVCSINNSLVAIDNIEEGLLKGFKNIFNIMTDDGIFILSLRPYDEYIKEKPIEPPKRQWKFRKINGYDVKFSQRYEWISDKNYICHSFYEIKDPNGATSFREEHCPVRAWTEKEICETLEVAGFSEIISYIIDVENTHYRERWFLARKRIK